VLYALRKTMNDSPIQLDTPPRHHNRWLILIAAFKVAQALLFAAVGVGVLRLLHKNVGDELQRFVDHLNFNTEPRFVNFLLEKADFITDRMLVRIGAAVFIYALLDLVEGIGLYFEQTWAEYLTLVVTASFLPWELFEVFGRITPIRVSLLTVNALVFIYLLKLVLARGRQRRSSVNGELDVQADTSVGSIEKR
jgi:uncharacterized membrane protein (DUF2068 family)